MAAVSVLAVTGLVAGCSGTETISGGPDPARVELDGIRLVSHDSCDGLLDWFHTEAAARVGPYGLEGDVHLFDSGAEFADSGATSRAQESSAGAPTPSAGASDPASATDATSTTNTQEPGIGEPDLVWTDGTRLVTILEGRLDVVDLTAGEVTSSLELPGGGSGAAPVGLLVQDDHALVIQRSYGYAHDEPARGGIRAEESFRSTMPAGTATTRLTRVDLGATGSTPAVVGSVTVDGDYVDARMVDGVVRAVVRSSPDELGFVHPSSGSDAAVDRAIAANREVVAASTIDDWLPSMTVEVDGDEVSSGRSVACDAVDHPAEFGGFGVVSVVGLDLGAGAVEPLPSAAVVADAQTVYASTDALYLATTHHPGQFLPAAQGSTTSTLPAEGDATRTDVHAFSLPGDVAARYEASGSVPGTLVDQFALSRHQGDLRVATTTRPESWARPMPIEDGPATGPASEPDVSEPVARPVVSESRVTVLRQDGDALDAVGEVTGLGPTEEIRGVRFAGPTAYVVTFRQTDPLYVVDLTDPTAPRVAGELKIPGYSSYLQVLDEGRVVGLGQDATDTGRATGFQESLFDVSDPGDPRRVAQVVVPGAQSLAETDHHAVLWWAPTGLLVVPVESWGRTGVEGSTGSGVLVSRIGDDSIEEVGTVTHPSWSGDGSRPPGCPPDAMCVGPSMPVPYPTPIVRTLMADGKLVTVSTAGVKLSDPTSLADLSWIPFG